MCDKLYVLFPLSKKKHRRKSPELTLIILWQGTSRTRSVMAAAALPALTCAIPIPPFVHRLLRHCGPFSRCWYLTPLPSVWFSFSAVAKIFTSFLFCSRPTITFLSYASVP